MNTGWLLATFVPQSTMRSDSRTSCIEHVLAATPIVCFRPTVEGAWHVRAAESMLATPIARADLAAA